MGSKLLLQPTAQARPHERKGLLALVQWIPHFGQHLQEGLLSLLRVQLEPRANVVGVLHAVQQAAVPQQEEPEILLGKNAAVLAEGNLGFGMGPAATASATPATAR